MDALIRVRSLCLDVPIFLQRERQADNWASMFLGAAFDPPRRAMTRLLDGLDFELREGDRLAILGRNGAGKSTLLRVLNRVYLPTSGSLEVRGTCQALLNMSLGFSAEATVRENIFLRGIAMGLRADYLRHQVEPILEFSGLQDKATHRLRTLSSGQKMRLGFAISTSVQNDIILMDEWVGAGDSEFMARATERMRSRVGGSKILVLASHSVGLLRSICNKGIVLEGGRLVFNGDIVPALEYYHASMAAKPSVEAQPEAADAAGAEVYGAAERITRVSDGRFRVTGWIVDTEGGIPGGVVMEVKGRRYVAARVRHHARPDVVRHFGLATPDCGFHAVFNVPGAASVADLGEDVRVFGGSSPGLAHAPLRIAPGFTKPGQPA